MSICECACAALKRMFLSTTFASNKIRPHLSSALLALATMVVVFVPRDAEANVTYTYIGNSFNYSFFGNGSSGIIQFPGDPTLYNVSCQGGGSISASFTFDDTIANFTGTL